MKYIYLVAVLLLNFILVGLLTPHSTSALSGSDFQAGRIADDGTFFNPNSLSPNDIQFFLNSKVPNCDTYGTQPYGGTTRAAYAASRGYPAPFTCLRNYTQDTPTKAAESGLCGQYNGGTKTSAQIIYDVGRACNINPKVLIILLEKEQSLVTDDWPWSVQYRSATGYGCPDTAPCDAEYYGFFNQVYNASRQFKKYERDQTLFRYRAGRVNYIQYNPNAGCGGTNVYIQNQATAGLYNYTPYQPNPSALANLYGTGDGCGAYGNRNFWRIYNDWFGTTYYSFGIRPSHTSAYANIPCEVTNYDDTWVGRLYNPDTQDFLFTRSKVEACQAVRYGYIWDDLVMKNATGVSAIPVYRIVNYSGHLYTSDIGIRDNYLNNYGYTDEGIAFYAYANSSASTTPVSMLTNGRGSFLLTSSGKESDYYQSTFGYYSFGVAFHTEALDVDNYTVARLGRNNTRLYTISPVEKTVALSQYGFRDEGNTAVNDAKPNSINTPVYRLRSPSGAYFYTFNRLERDVAVVNYNYISEGTGFYMLLYSNKPIFRASNYQNGLKIFTDSRIEYDISMSSYNFRGEGIGWYSY